MSGASASRRRRATYQVGIINLDRDWQPDHWSDVPPSGTIVRVAAICRSLARAQGWVFGYNSAALTEQGRQWAVILRRGPIARPGDECIRQPEEVISYQLSVTQDAATRRQALADN
jgi:hypothetical protein